MEETLAVKEVETLQEVPNNVLYAKRNQYWSRDIYLYAEKEIIQVLADCFAPAKEGFIYQSVYNGKLKWILHIPKLNEDHVKFLIAFLKGLERGFDFKDLDPEEE